MAYGGWQTIDDVREFLFDKCVMAPRTIAQVWKEHGVDATGLAGHEEFVDKLKVYLNKPVDFFKPGRKESARTTLMAAIEWGLLRADSSMYDLSRSIGKQLWVDQVVADMAGRCLETDVIWLDSKFQSEDEVPRYTLVLIPAFHQYFPRPTKFSDVALSLFRGEMSDPDRLTFDFDREMLWPSFPKDVVEEMFTHSPANRLRFASVPIRVDPGEQSADDEDSEEDWQRIANRSFGQYHYEEDWTKHKGGLKLLQFASDEAADAADLEFHKRCVLAGSQLYAKASGASGPCKRVDPTVGAAWLAQVEENDLKAAKMSPFYKK